MLRRAAWLLGFACGLASCSLNRADAPGPDAASPPPAPPPPASAAAAPPAASQPAPAPEPAAESPPRRACVVAAVGDSLTDARASGGKFLDLLKQRCPGSRFDNFGKGGDMVNQMRRRFTREVFGAYTHVIVFGGVNDLYSDKTAFRTVPKIQEDLSKMYALARERGARVVAITVAPWGGFTRYYNADRAATTRQLNAWILGRPAAGEVDHAIDAYALLSCGDPERLCPEYAEPFRDGLHFGPKGHEKLGEALHEAAFSGCL